MSVAVVITTAVEAEGLTRWAMIFSHTEPGEKVIFLAPPDCRVAVEEAIESWRAEHPDAAATDLRELEGQLTAEAVLSAIDRPEIDLLVVGKNRLPGVSRDHLQLNRELFDRALCTTLMIRLGKRRATECDSILIPSAGGPNSREALRLGTLISKNYCGSVSPLFVEPETGVSEDDRAVGERILNRVLDEVGIDRTDTEHVRKQIVVANDTDLGILQAARKQPYDLLLIGATHSSTVRRKLFGAIPDRLLEGEDALTVAVIRRRRTAGERLRERIERFFSLRIPQLERADRIAMFERLQTSSGWSFDFMTLIVLSTGIASLGLIQSSPAVVIGAMLVAPLMTPLIGSGLALVQGNLPLMRQCLKSIVLGFLAAACVGLLAGIFAPVAELTGELRARGGPTILDMGVAFLSGIAASYCIARPGLSSALAGVAIAAALVPPVATAGISLALLEFANARGAAVLFGTNVVAIILGAALNFFAAGIRGRNASGGAPGLLWVRRTVVGLLIAAAILVVPLSTTIVSKAAARFGFDRRATIEHHLDEALSAAGFQLEESATSIDSLSRDPETGATVIQATVRAGRTVPASVARDLAAFARESLGRELVNVRIRTEIVTIATDGASDP